MNLTVFGATGKTGARVVTRALAAGHEVTAVTRGPQSLPVHPALRVVVADVMKPADIVTARMP